MADRIRLLRRPRRHADDRPFKPAPHRHGRSAFPVLQHRDDRDYRRTILEALPVEPSAPRAAARRVRHAAGTASNLYQYRPPIDLADARLRKLAAALAPAYVRVSGTWANSTYFADQDNPPPAPPAGFNGVLTRQQWRGVVDFSQAVDARIVTSFAVSPGVRDAAGAWKPDQADRLLAYTSSIGGRIAAAEFMNEPNLAEMGGAPAGYDATAYARDFGIFHAFMKQRTDKTLILGPGTVGEPAIASDLLAASGSGIDAVSYHYYGTLSERCSGKSTPETALSEEWLSGTDRDAGFLSKTSRQIRTRQADLAHGNRGCRMRWQSVGRDLPGYVPLSRSARAAGESRRSGRHAQHAGGERLRPARRDGPCSPGRNTGARCSGGN